MTPDQIIKLCDKYGLDNAVVKVRRSIAGDPVYSEHEYMVTTVGAGPGPSFFDIVWFVDGVEHWFEISDGLSEAHVDVLIQVLATGKAVKA